jgi:hypothetical protein
MDYNLRKNWIALPREATENVDVFYVYPTICQFPQNAVRHNMNPNNPFFRLFAWAVTTQHTGVFDGCNIYAPLYRQVGLEGLKMPLEVYRSYAKQAYLDVRKAFCHYLKHHNNGRPFILAGHSQGSIMLLELMKREFHKPGLMKKLVAAYLIGFSVTEQDIKTYPHLKIAQGEADTGVIITFNTGTTKYKKPLPIILPGTFCVNPLNWHTDSEYAGREAHLGAVFLKIGKKPLIERGNYTGAYVSQQKNMLIIDEPMSIRLLRIANIAGAKLAIHSFDYAIFYRNLQKNVKTRIKAYMESNSQDLIPQQL